MTEQNQLYYLDTLNVAIEEEVELVYDSVTAEGYKHEELLSVKQEPKDENSLPHQEFEFISVKEELKQEQQPAPEVLTIEDDVEGPLALEEDALDSPVTEKYRTCSRPLQGIVEMEKQVTDAQESSTSSSSTDAERDCESGSRCGDEDGTKQLRTTSQAFTCSTCSAVFTSKYKLIRHVFSHTVGVPPPRYICQICGDVFLRAVHLMKHSVRCKESQHKTPVEKCMHASKAEGKCDVCVKSLVQSASLRRQLNTQNNKDKSWNCEICGKSYSKIRALKIHKRIHTGEKPYECEICDKRFSGSGDLKRHKRVHTREKPYKCEICGKGFSQSGNLQCHKRIHTGEKPYECEICGSSFSSSGALHKHTRVHTGEKPYECDICGKSLASSWGLQTHKSTHWERGILISGLWCQIII